MSYLENPLVTPSPLEKCFLRDMAEVAKDCYYRGWAPATSGNFSVHLRRNLVWQSPSGVCKGRLTGSSFIPISLESQAAWGFSLGKPSEEMPVHLGIYRRHDEARCVVHAHPPHFIKHSKGKSELVFEGYEIQKAVGSESFCEQLTFRVAPNQTREGLEGFCHEQLETYLHTQAKLIMFEGHGIYAWADSPLKALQCIEAVESLCTGKN
ncbi:MAG: class II aldolase/adducin family protein [Oligoflexales bacterium]|nr:class II aldolase/adducin family protein [Oligoflexales bacterium]